MRTLRLDGESDDAFRIRAERMAEYARTLIDACFQNRCLLEYLADPELDIYTEESIRRSPIVRVEYEQAIAIGGIGECLDATRNKNWGDGPWIMPLEPDDDFFSYRITYVYRENSLYNRRFEQRRRMKELLGRQYRTLVERAKYQRHTQKMFLDGLRADEREAIQRVFGTEPVTFWRACRGKVFLDLPARTVQTEFGFMDDV